MRSSVSIERHLAAPGLRRGQRGFTLVEIMVALLLSLFLIGGLLTMVQSTRSTFGNQNQLAQLQDSERLAMTMITNVIQQTGYFPDPTTNTPTSEFVALAAPLVTVAGQAIAGATAFNAGGDELLVQYATSGADNLLNCNGATSAVPVTVVNVFTVNTASNGGELQCSVNGAAPVALVSGVQRLQVWYGVKTDTSVDNGAVDSYIQASDMTAAYWSQVISVRVTLTFTNPLSGQPGQPATIPFTRVVGLMNQAGVKT